MPVARIISVEPGSPASLAGVLPGDELVAVDGRVPRDVLEYRLLVDGADPDLELRRGGVELTVPVAKDEGRAMGLEVDSPVFDRVMTCDNHCEFCFIYQLPKGMRPSLSLKDDDYRLSFLYGNFTTLTRFTELDLERVVTEGLSPLHVSIHATDPQVRSEMLRNRRGATSLRWLRALLDHGIEVHGQVVVCPGVNDGDVLEATLVDVADRYAELASVCVVPLGVSRHSHEPRMRPHTRAEAEAVVDVVAAWQERFRGILGRRLVFASDEYHLLAGRELPPAEEYEGFGMHEDGVGMLRCFEEEFLGAHDGAGTRPRSGFFAAVDGAPAHGYRAPRQLDDGAVPVALSPRRRAPVAVLTGEAAAPFLSALVERHAPAGSVRVVAVPNRFFGGTTSVAGLLTGEDLAATLAEEPTGHRYLLPDVCLSQGRFLDGVTVDDLPRAVEVVPTDGATLRRVLDGARPLATADSA